MDKQDTLMAETWVSELQLTRSQKSAVAISIIISIALAILAVIVLVGPVLNVLGLQAIGT